MTTSEALEIEIISLPPLTEIRFLMNVGDKVNVELTDGTAVSFGWKLPTHTQIEFSNQSFSITTKSGCTIKISGRYISYYTTSFKDEDFSLCPYMEIVNSVKESVDNAHPPTVIIVGAPSVGKTTLCKWICNTILSSGPQSHVPIFINADPDQSPFCPPGCIGAIPITTPINNYGFPFTDPLMYMFSATKVDEKRNSLYIDQMKELMRHVAERRKASGTLDGGTVIDFPTVNTKCIFDVLGTIITSYEEGIAKSLGPLRVVVVGNDKLFTNLLRTFPGLPLYKVPMLPGVIPLSKEAKAEIRRNEIARYFYGDGHPDLLPQTYLLGKEEVPLYSLGQWRVLNDSMMPINYEYQDPKEVFPVSFGDIMRSFILAILPQENKSIIWKQSILGFIHVISYLDEEKQLNVLKPNSDPLKKCVLIASEVKWEPKS